MVIYYIFGEIQMYEDLIEKFFEKQLMTATNSQRSYRGNINKYFRLLNKDINKYFNENKSLDEYENDLTKVYSILEKQNTPLLTRRTFFNSIKQFMKTYDKRTKNLDFWDLLKRQTKGAEPISTELVPNNNDIKQVLTHGNALSRAMFLMMASTGMRIGEVLALYPIDIKLNEKPVIVHISKTYDRKNPDSIKNLTKTKKSRDCFISDEAKDALVEWLKIRDDYIKTAVSKSRYGKDDTDKRIFPMSDENAREIWSNLVKKSGLYEIDSNTNRLKLHPHCLRKFFRSYFGNADLAEHFMGHQTGMTKFYRNKKKEDLSDEYQMYMHNVTVFSSGPSSERLNDMQNQLSKKDEQIQELLEKQRYFEIRMQGLENALNIEKLKNGKKMKEDKY
jgi:integrase